jgi:hypothetical protein
MCFRDISYKHAENKFNKFSTIENFNLPNERMRLSISLKSRNQTIQQGNTISTNITKV